MWAAELRIYDADQVQTDSVVVGTASMVCVDALECDDFVVDVDWLGADLGEMADVVRRTLMEDENGILVRSNVRVLFVTDVAVDPHWRGRQIGPAVPKIAARTIGCIDAIYLIPSALQTSRDEDGTWTTSYDSPRPGRTAQEKVRKAWKDAGFSRRLGKVYQLLLDDELAREEAQAAHHLLTAVEFAEADRLWWDSTRRVTL